MLFKRGDKKSFIYIYINIYSHEFDNVVSKSVSTECRDSLFLE